MNKKLISCVLLTAIICTGCSTRRIKPVDRNAFINALEEINSTKVYDASSLTSFSLREALGDNWNVSDNELTDGSYCLGAVNGLNRVYYMEIADGVPDVDEGIIGIIDDYASIGLLYDEYTSTNVYYAGRVNSFGNPGGECYLVYSSGYSYVSECDFVNLIYRNYNTLLIFTADSESRFDALVNEIGFPELHEFNSVFDFGQGNIYLDDDEQVFSYFIFDDNDAATQYFEDRYYDNFVDICEDHDFDGYYLYNRFGERGDYSGYVLLNGEFDDAQYDYAYGSLTEIYGGIYLKDNVVIVVFSRTNSQRRMDIVDQFINEIGLPIPPKD